MTLSSVSSVANLQAIAGSNGDVEIVAGYREPGDGGGGSFHLETFLVVTGATNATPIVITTSAPHQYVTGQSVVIAGVGGNTAANGTRTITVVGTSTFSLDGSAGNGVYTSGGTATTIPASAIITGVSQVSASIATVTPGNPVIVETASAHGYETGQVVVIIGVAGTGLIGAVNAGWTVTSIDGTKFSLNGSNVSGAYSSGGTANTVTISTSAAHALVSGQLVVIAGVGGAPAVNGAWVATVATATTFSIGVNITGSAYTSGGLVGDGGTSIPSTAVVGRWLRLLDGSALTPQMFGCAGDGLANDTVRLQAFWIFVSNNACDGADCTGTFQVNDKIVIRGSATKTIHCNFKLITQSGFATENQLLEVIDALYVYFQGRIELLGTGGATWSTRSIGSGMTISNCSRAKFDMIVIANFKYQGIDVLETGNSTMLDLGQVVCTDCGPYALTGGGSRIATWSSPVKNGSSGSVAQTMTLGVTIMPPSNHYEYSLCSINDYVYIILSADFVANTITVYPWVENAISLGTGTVSYLFGGGIDIFGADSGIIKVGMLDARRCSVGLRDRALYGVVAQRLVAQSCGIGVALGRAPNAAHVTSVFDGSYYEGNKYDIVQVTRVNVSTWFNGTYALNLTECLSIGWPRTSSETITDTRFQGVNILGEHGQLLFETLAREGATGNPTPDVALRQEHSILALYGDSKSSITLYKNSDMNRLFGTSTVMFTGFGTGSNKQPTGAWTFDANDVGYTVMGGSSYTLSGFVNPPLIICYLLGTDWRVVCSELGQPLRASAAGINPASLAAGAADVIRTLAITGSALGDLAQATFTLDLQGVKLNAWVSAANTVSYQFTNPTAGTIDLGSGTVRVAVTKM